jgi:signal transduction histidine kinase
VSAEAIANVEKYAHATRVLVGVSQVGNTLRLEIRDDGIGGAVERPGRGLEGLRDRVEGIGGTFELESITGRGTRIAVAVPCIARTA